MVSHLPTPLARSVQRPSATTPSARTTLGVGWGPEPKRAVHRRLLRGLASTAAAALLALTPVALLALTPVALLAQSGSAVAESLRLYMNTPLAAPVAELEEKAKTHGVKATLDTYFTAPATPTSTGSAYGYDYDDEDISVSMGGAGGADVSGIAPGGGYAPGGGGGGQVDEAHSVVYKAFLQHPEWQKAVVVADWTGSMYPYTGMVLRWHKQNVDKQVIANLVLFNDGDDNIRGGKAKVAGHIGGIYHTDPKDIEGLLGVIETAVNNGDGGDSEENDIEALLSAQAQYPDAPYLILIADNSPIRDMELLGKLTKPVHVLLCNGGYVPDYMKLAYTTGGSITLLEDDLDFATLAKKPGFDPSNLHLNGVKYNLAAK